MTYMRRLRGSSCHVHDEHPTRAGVSPSRAEDGETRGCLELSHAAGHVSRAGSRPHARRRTSVARRSGPHASWSCARRWSSYSNARATCVETS